MTSFIIPTSEGDNPHIIAFNQDEFKIIKAALHSLKLNTIVSCASFEQEQQYNMMRLYERFTNEIDNVLSKVETIINM